MAGHSKWANIKRRKSAVDAKRSKVFTKLIKEITVAARMGGVDETANARLRSAIAAAKAANMPSANVERAIKKGGGDLDGADYHEITYEGYGPGGVAVLVDCLTDNRNRTVGEVRHAFTRHGGKMAESGAVSWIFETKGMLIVDTDNEMALMEVALESGADDLSRADDGFEVRTDLTEMMSVKEALEAAGYKVPTAELQKVPGNTVPVDESQATTLFKLIAVLEDNDDVQNVWANFEIDDALMEKLSLD